MRHHLQHPARYLWLRLLLLIPLLALASANTKADMLMKCFEANTCSSERMTWGDFIADKPSCFVAARVWWSEEPPGLPVTLITQLSASRLDQLYAQCAHWHGPLAAAIYLPLLNPSLAEMLPENRARVQQAIATVDAFVKDAEAKRAKSGRGCQPRVMLMYELFAEARAVMLYPIDSMRNYARLMADTDLLTNIDVDMIPSSTIYTELTNSTLLAEYSENCRHGAQYVWPAFEAYCGEVSYAEEVATSGKERVANALKNCLQIFHPNVRYLHNATDFPRWLSTDAPYQIKYEPRFEPWFLSWRWNTLWFDVRCRGYGRDKMVHSAASKVNGASWFVSGTGFIVHRQHKNSPASDVYRALFNPNAKDSMMLVHQALHRHQNAVLHTSLEEMIAGTYFVRLEPQFKSCLDSLPWWRQEGRQDKEQNKEREGSI